MRFHRHNAFTLIELLVVISIIALLIGVLLPVLGSVRQSARVTKDLANLRSMQQAHTTFVVDNNWKFIDIGLGHGGGAHADEQAAWINTLSGYYGTPLVHRSELDNSPHWGPAPEGDPIPGAPVDQRRRTSYGVNNYLTDISPSTPYLKMNQVPQPASVIQFLHMAQEGSFAGADHPHVENWFNPFLPGIAPRLADDQVQIDAAGGKSATSEALSNWGFLDGHAATLPFGEVYRTPDENKMDPEVAR